jgi:hypothetical protein
MDFKGLQGITRDDKGLQGSKDFKVLSSYFQGTFKGLSRDFQGTFKGLSRDFQDTFYVIRMSFGIYCIITNQQ